MRDFQCVFARLKADKLKLAFFIRIFDMRRASFYMSDGERGIFHGTGRGGELRDFTGQICFVSAILICCLNFGKTFRSCQLQNN